ncbi:MAG TPA: deoxyribodipyrimidine photo-lyase, partial [Roseivirga sp.]
MSRAIYWFRNDLRVEDNEGLKLAVDRFDEVIPLYVLDEEWLNGSQFGIERMGVHRLKFLLESLVDLKQKLQNLGSNLYFRVGKPEAIIEEMKKQYNCDTLLAQKASAH